MSIRIEDDGCGLPASVAAGADGLINLRRRMDQIGGQCEIVNRSAGGVSVGLSLSLAARQKKGGHNPEP